MPPAPARPENLRAVLAASIPKPSGARLIKKGNLDILAFEFNKLIRKFDRAVED